MSVDEYLDMMLSNDVVHDLILKHLTKLERVLSDNACFVVEQISDFDLDVIEVSNGYAFRISTRAFFRFRKEDFRGKSSRAFVPYDCLSPPDPGRFAEGINNSFPDLEELIKALNKLYQCLVVGQMPREIRKLVLAGPENSGKTHGLPCSGVSCRLISASMSPANYWPVWYRKIHIWLSSTIILPWTSRKMYCNDLLPTTSRSTSPLISWPVMMTFIVKLKFSEPGAFRHQHLGPTGGSLTMPWTVLLGWLM